MSKPKRYFSADDLADAKNARGFGVPWERIASHNGVSVDEIKQACGEPAWKSEPAKLDAEPGIDLWRVDHDVL